MSLHPASLILPDVSATILAGVSICRCLNRGTVFLGHNVTCRTNFKLGILRVYRDHCGVAIVIISVT